MDNIRVDDVRKQDRVWFKAELINIDKAISVIFKSIGEKDFALLNFPQAPSITEGYLSRKSKAIKGIYDTIEQLRHRQFNN